MYATVMDVEVYVPARSPFTANSKPSATQVARLIGDAEAEVDAALTKAGYAVPIASTATVAFAQVRAAVAQTAAALVEQVAPTGDERRRKHYQEMSDAAIKALCAGELPGVARDSAQANARYDTLAATAFFKLDTEF